jgi:hypothetical protein
MGIFEIYLLFEEYLLRDCDKVLRDLQQLLINVYIRRAGVGQQITPTGWFEYGRYS